MVIPDILVKGIADIQDQETKQDTTKMKKVGNLQNNFEITTSRNKSIERLAHILALYIWEAQVDALDGIAISCKATTRCSEKQNQYSLRLFLMIAES